jgi:hypothetical protein
MKALRYLVLCLFCFFGQIKSEAQISKLAKPNLRPVQLLNLRLLDDQKTIIFDLEFKNVGEVTANLTGIKTRCYLCVRGAEPIITNPNIIHVGTSEKGYRGDDVAPLGAGQSRIYTRLSVTTFDGKDLSLFPEILIYLDATEVIEESSDDDNRMYYTHGFPVVVQSENTGGYSIGYAKPADLKLSVSNVTTSTYTDAGTGVKYKAYNFTCTIKNIGEGIAIINSTKKLTYQAYRVNDCNSNNLGPAGGANLGLGYGLVQIMPGESIVLQNQNAGQPLDAITKIKVELLYGGDDADLTNNNACLMP